MYVYMFAVVSQTYLARKYYIYGVSVYTFSSLYIVSNHSQLSFQSPAFRKGLVFTNYYVISSEIMLKINK